MIHVIGANGYIGSRLCKELDAQNILYDCYSDVADDKCKKYDLLSSDSTSLSFQENDIVVLLAAVSSPDVCQNNYDYAYKINVIGTSKLIDYCILKKVKVIFMSSDTVNGQTTHINDEHSDVAPFGNYAKMKYEIECKYRNNRFFKALRLSYVLSDSDKFTSYLSKCICNGSVAEVFRGLFRNVVKIEVVLEAIVNLCQNFDFNDYYLVNVSGNENLSRLDLAKWYKTTIDSRLEYKEIAVPKTILQGRPNIINVRSLYLEKLLGHKIDNLLEKEIL